MQRTPHTALVPLNAVLEALESGNDCEVPGYPYTYLAPGYMPYVSILTLRFSEYTVGWFERNWTVAVVSGDEQRELGQADDNGRFNVNWSTLANCPRDQTNLEFTEVLPETPA